MTTRRIVLVVEDDKAILEFLEWALADEGYEVVSAPDGAAALKTVETLSPDLILLDLLMPRMDGPSFARAYHARPQPHAPIVLISASNEAPKLASVVGAVEHLAKPFNLELLLAIIDRHLPLGTFARDN